MAALAREPIRRAWRHAIIQGWDDPAPHRIRSRRRSATACWVWEADSAEHRVFIGEDIRCNKPGAVVDEGYLRAYLYHELAHARWTARNLAGVKRAAQAAGGSMRLLNLLEDARIEHFWREATGFAFRWTRWEIEVDSLTVRAHFFRLIQTEGAAIGKGHPAWGEAVDVFYQRCCQASDTWAVITIMSEMIAQFPELKNPPGPSESGILEGRPNDMSVALDLMTAGALLSEAKAMSAPLAGKDDGRMVSDMDDVPANEGQGAFQSVTAQDASNGEVLPHLIFRPLTDEETDAAVTLTGVLEREFQSRTGRYSSNRPSKRLSVRSLANDDAKPYRHQGRPGRGTIDVSLVLDLSGSMSGEPMFMSRVLTKSFSLLAQRGRLRGHVVLPHGRLKMVQTLTLPMADSDIGRIGTSGGLEYLDGGMRVARKALQESDLCFCVTDGHICDDPIDTASLKAAGIEVMGLYLGDPDDAENLDEWFQYSLARPDLLSFTQELGVRMRPYIRKRGQAHAF